MNNRKSQPTATSGDTTSSRYPFLSVDRKNGVSPIVILLLRITCKHCRFVFSICRSCWRGQAYCCGLCRKTARRLSHRKAQKNYRQTEKGKKQHRLAEQKRRSGRALKKIKKTVADRGSTPRRLHDSLGDIVKLLFNRCHICDAIGQIVDLFPRRGYGRQQILTNIGSKA